MSSEVKYVRLSFLISLLLLFLHETSLFCHCLFSFSLSPYWFFQCFLCASAILRLVSSESFHESLPFTNPSGQVNAYVSVCPSCFQIGSFHFQMNPPTSLHIPNRAFLIPVSPRECSARDVLSHSLTVFPSLSIYKTAFASLRRSITTSSRVWG